MLEIQHKNAIYLFNFDQPKPDQIEYFSPEFWQKQKRILGSAQGRGTTWFLRTQDLFGVNCALRHYYRGGLWGKINRDLYLYQSLAKARSVAEFHLLNDLRSAGLKVPKPIGARVEKVGYCHYRADILTEKVENAQDLTALLQSQTLSSKTWFEIGKIIRRLHNLNVCHTDLNAHNILIQQQDTLETIWLLDFDKCGKKSGENWKLENLARLKRSFLKEVERMHIKFTQADWEWLLQGYSR